MIERDLICERLKALFLLGVLLLLPPLLLAFNRPVLVLGIPLLYLYLLVVWVGLIGLTAAIVGTIAAAAAPDEQAADAVPPGEGSREGVRRA